MRVRCESNVAAGGWSSTSHLLRSEYALIVGREYDVVALVLYQGLLGVLLHDENELHCWTPIRLFTVIDGRMPDWWTFASFASDGTGVEAIWGYEELVAMGGGHYKALIEFEPEAQRIFHREWRKVQHSSGV